MEKTLINKEDLASYVLYKWKQDYKEQLSLIKFNRIIFILFAEVSSKTMVNQVEDETIEKGFLFDASFKAFPYGFVEIYLYNKYKNKELKDSSSLNIENNMIKEYIDELLADLFTISDFRLVDIVRQDNYFQEVVNLKEAKIDNYKILKDYQH